LKLYLYACTCLQVQYMCCSSRVCDGYAVFLSYATQAYGTGRYMYMYAHGMRVQLPPQLDKGRVQTSTLRVGRVFVQLRNTCACILFFSGSDTRLDILGHTENNRRWLGFQLIRHGGEPSASTCSRLHSRMNRASAPPAIAKIDTQPNE